MAVYIIVLFVTLCASLFSHAGGSAPCGGPVSA